MENEKAPIGTAFKIDCRGIDKEGNPVLSEDSKEQVIIRITPVERKSHQYATPYVGFRNDVFCRHLVIYPDRDNGWKEGYQCMAGESSRKLDRFLDQDDTRRCPYRG
jgi:hypothetical protein